MMIKKMLIFSALILGFSVSLFASDQVPASRPVCDSSEVNFGPVITGLNPCLATCLLCGGNYTACMKECKLDGSSEVIAQSSSLTGRYTLNTKECLDFLDNSNFDSVNNGEGIVITKTVNGLKIDVGHGAATCLLTEN